MKLKNPKVLIVALLPLIIFLSMSVSSRQKETSASNNANSVVKTKPDNNPVAKSQTAVTKREPKEVRKADYKTPINKVKRVAQKPYAQLSGREKSHEIFKWFSVFCISFTSLYAILFVIMNAKKKSH